ncbi:MAG TPA: hypothetical protein VM513_01535 [Kofleriaceae bacterium]|jgi:hypothetical protein|nr:hypothetical protein [Kofleriaceae bacterium]
MHRSPLALCTSLTLALSAACVVEEAPSVGQVDQRLDVEVSEPEMWMYCTDCRDGHIVGEPVTIATSYNSTCEGLWDYECNPQPYSLSIECLDGPCEIDPAGDSSDGYLRYTHVIPLDTGPLRIRVRMAAYSGATSKVVTFLPFESFVPDQLRVTCTQDTQGTNRGLCVEGPNEPPFHLAYALYAGTRPLFPRESFQVTSSQPGYNLGNNDQDWFASAPGEHVVQARYGELSIESRVIVKSPPPPRSVQFATEASARAE